jgi:hypothetical protein
MILLLCILLLSTVNAHSAGPITEHASFVQILRSPGLQFDGNVSVWTVAINSTCNSLRCVEPFAGALLELSLRQLHLLLRFWKSRCCLKDYSIILCDTGKQASL